MPSPSLSVVQRLLLLLPTWCTVACFVPSRLSLSGSTAFTRSLGTKVHIALEVSEHLVGAVRLGLQPLREVSVAEDAHELYPGLENGIIDGAVVIHRDVLSVAACGC